MAIRVYKDKEAPGDSIGIRGDGTVTCVYGDSYTLWRENAKSYAWVAGPLAAAILATADMDDGPLFTIDEED